MSLNTKSPLNVIVVNYQMNVVYTEAMCLLIGFNLEVTIYIWFPTG